MKRSLKQFAATFREFAMGYPDAVEDHPWGESAFKVNKKVFLFMSLHEGVLRLTTKLPKSRKKALKHTFAAPTGYGLGKSGWITSSFEAGDDVPVDLLTDWIDESFRTIAPRRIVAYLDDNEMDERPIIVKKPPRRARPRART
jgi:predicted DNA-binding protein (MmcQ/YjbR family)